MHLYLVSQTIKVYTVKIPKFVKDMGFIQHDILVAIQIQ